jgi:hypothetical protein
LPSFPSFHIFLSSQRRLAIFSLASRPHFTYSISIFFKDILFMSWILGVIGKLTETERARIKACHPHALSIVETDHLSLASGGLGSTCLHGRFSPAQSNWDGWLVVGLGMHREHAHVSFFDDLQWGSVLSQPQPDMSDVDGHFVALRFHDREVQVFTDQLGMRGFYAAKTTGGVIFSTRMDWVAQISNNHEIDFESFGPQWLGFNQISCGSPVHNIHRFGPGSTARCTADSIEYQDTLWRPDAGPYEETDFENVLTPFLLPRTIPPPAISFGLSGGLDSRVLLAMYTAIGVRDLRLHVFGDSIDPDVIVSSRIAGRLHYTHIHEKYVPQSPDELLHRLREYLAQIYVTNPASAIMSVGAVDSVAAHASLILDGSFGEIARRQSYNRLLIKGSGALRSRDANRMIQYMRIFRADIFSRGTRETMERGFLRQMQWYVDETASSRNISDEDFVDLMTIRTRFPNYSGVEQARTDAFIMGYMPYLQPSVLRSTFRIPMHLKRNGRLFRQIIRRSCPELASFPLVKSGTTYPFRFTTVPAHLWTSVKKRIGKPYTDMRMFTMLDMVKEYTLDLAHSEHIKSFAAYDVRKIQSIVERYYAGERRWAHEVDWWLSFELWRQALTNNC